jgi:RNA polymerase sigma factor (sigma-70 family)
MLPPDEPFTELRNAREHFLALVAEVRPDLHRYCARMTGSVTDGEDVVQDTLARAYFMLPELPAMPELRPWLFRVAHNRAIDFLRRYDRRMSEPLEADVPFVADGLTAADDALAAQEAVAAALTRFVELPPVPRSCVILKDVLGHSLDDIAGLLELGLPAVKAALHRGRERLRAAAGEIATAVPGETPAPSPAIARYIELFNARDWDAVRAMLADDVRLDVVSRARRHGRRDVGAYVSNYANAHDWHLRPAWLGDREVIAVLRDPTATAPTYFVELSFEHGRVQDIRDYRYVPYVAIDAPLRLARIEGRTE